MVQVQVDLTPVEMRKMVVEDVLKQLKNHKLQAKCGAYLKVKPTIEPENLKMFDITNQIKDNVDNIQSQCTACALGSVFLSYVRKFNNCKFIDVGLDSLGSLSSCDNRIKLIDAMNCFTQNQLDLIECCFECNKTSLHTTLSTKQEYNARAFGWRFNTDRQRLIGIMNNMVENNYNFIP